jgi:hypothetical protein
MLDTQVIKKIEDFVYSQPRSIQEIAEHIGKNWRTADRYVDEIIQNFGTISNKIFRGGTRGALKIVYWSSIDKVSHSIFQKELEQNIINGRKKEDFSAFDIYQHIDMKNKNVRIEEEVNEEETDLNELVKLLESAKKQILLFSGNLSFINLKNKEADVFKILDNLAKKGILIKVICRVDLAGKENIEKLLSLNFKYGKERIEVRHREQPLRAVIADNSNIRLKEIVLPTGKIREPIKKKFIFYNIKDKEWTEWLTKIFWKMFNSSMSADKRLQEIKTLA